MQDRGKIRRPDYADNIECQKPRLAVIPLTAGTNGPQGVHIHQQMPNTSMEEPRGNKPHIRVYAIAQDIFRNTTHIQQSRWIDMCHNRQPVHIAKNINTNTDDDVRHPGRSCVDARNVRNSVYFV